MILSAIADTNMQQSGNVPKVWCRFIIPIHLCNIFCNWTKQGQCAPPKKTAISDKCKAAWPSWGPTSTNQVFPDWTKKGQGSLQEDNNLWQMRSCLTFMGVNNYQSIKRCNNSYKMHIKQLFIMKFSKTCISKITATMSTNWSTSFLFFWWRQHYQTAV